MVEKANARRRQATRRGRAAGRRRALAKAITLIESTHPEHRQRAHALLDAAAATDGRSLRIGITGVPGVGKSTFIEALGSYLIGQGHRVAVLAVDPSSSISGGSILGDKTRMDELSRRQEAFIRPSPAGRHAGRCRQTHARGTCCSARRRASTSSSSRRSASARRDRGRGHDRCLRAAATAPMAATTCRRSRRASSSWPTWWCSTRPTSTARPPNWPWRKCARRWQCCSRIRPTGSRRS